METLRGRINLSTRSSMEIAGLLKKKKKRRKNNYDKWKNHFSEMKGDVGMSLHEKEGEQEDAYTETGSH